MRDIFFFFLSFSAVMCALKLTETFLFDFVAALRLKPVIRFVTFTLKSDLQHFRASRLFIPLLYTWDC